MTITDDALDLTLQPLTNPSPLDMTLGNSPSFNPGLLLATSCSHWTSVQICSLDLTVQPPPFPRRQHLAVSSETGTNCKRAVHILPECFLVVCVVLLFKLSLCNSNVSYCSSNIQTIDRSKGTLRANDALSNILPNNRLVPPYFGLVPLLRNPGSATVNQRNTLIKQESMSVGYVLTAAEVYTLGGNIYWVYLTP